MFKTFFADLGNELIDWNVRHSRLEVSTVTDVGCRFLLPMRDAGRDANPNGAASRPGGERQQNRSSRRGCLKTPTPMACLTLAEELKSEHDSLSECRGIVKGWGRKVAYRIPTERAETPSRSLIILSPWKLRRPSTDAVGVSKYAFVSPFFLLGSLTANAPAPTHR